MGKKENPFDKKTEYPYPSRFGSHASMIDGERTEALTNASLVVLKDENGFYTTERNRLDSGMADANRYSGDRVKLKKLEAEEKN